MLTLQGKRPRPLYSAGHGVLVLLFLWRFFRPRFQILPAPTGGNLFLQPRLLTRSRRRSRLLLEPEESVRLPCSSRSQSPTPTATPTPISSNTHSNPHPNPHLRPTIFNDIQTERDCARPVVVVQPYWVHPC